MLTYVRGNRWRSGWFGLAALVLGFGLAASPARAEEGICAHVTLQLEQQMVITRTAFRATLELNNGLDAEYLEEVTVTLDIRDEFGEPADDRFNTSQLELTGIGAIDGTDVLPPNSSCTVSWTMIPYYEAAPTEPTFYDVGAELSYIQGDELFVIPMYPERITVLPDPILHVKYFWQRDVFADDPFTDDVIEPSEPFSLGLMIHNSGAGVAHNMRITSGQPEIIDNEDGLLINFQLIGTQVGTEEVSPSLTVDFGDVEPGDTAIARFLMISSLQGHFISYDVEYEHVTGLGDPRLSLIESPVKIYELIHVVRVDQPEDDELPDFLVNLHTWYDFPPEPWEDPRDPHEVPGDPERLDLPDTLFLSDNTTAFVTPLVGDEVTVTPDEPNHQAFVSAPMPGGWVYMKFPDPFDGAFALVRVERSDGSEVMLDSNGWQTDRTFVDGRRGQNPTTRREHRIHMFDESGDGQFTLFFVPDTDPPSVVKWQTVAAHGDPAGDPPDLPLDVWIDGEFSEPRASGIYRLVVLFNEPISPESFNLLTIHALAGPDGTEIQIDTPYTMTLTDNRMRGEIVFDEPLPNFVRYCFRLIGVTDVAGNPLSGGEQVIITALVGDATGDRRVDNTDVGTVGALVGTDPIDPSQSQHLRADVNHDGLIDEADVAIVLEARNQDARFIPNPCSRRGAGDKRSLIPKPTLLRPGEQF